MNGFSGKMVGCHGKDDTTEGVIDVVYDYFTRFKVKKIKIKKSVDVLLF